MSKIAIVTDSNSGYTQSEADAAGIYLIPMPFYIDGKEYFEGVNLTREDFFEALNKDADVSTSQPSPGSIMNLWDKILEMIELGKDTKEILEYLERTKMDSSIYITVATLKHLKKGGRVTPAAAALGTLLKIKPVLQIHGKKLDSYAKARTVNQAKHIMIEALKKDIDEMFDGNSEEVHFDIAYTCTYEAALEMKALLEETFPNCDEIIMDPLSLSISCHVGEGALGIACTKKLDV